MPHLAPGDLPSYYFKYLNSLRVNFPHVPGRSDFPYYDDPNMCTYMWWVSGIALGTQPIPRIHLLFAFPLFIFFFKLKNNTHTGKSERHQSRWGVFTPPLTNILAAQNKNMLANKKNFGSLIVRIFSRFFTRHRSRYMAKVFITLIVLYCKVVSSLTQSHIFSDFWN